MRLSAFNLYVDDYPDSGSTLVHNTFSGAYVVLDEDTLRALRKLDAGEALSDAERALTDDPDFVDENVAILVDSHEAEEAEFQQWFERRRSRKDALHCIVGVNLACNFECPYCSQAGILDGTVMTEEIADATADWLAREAIAAGVEALEPIFVGGEPLLHTDRVVRIATRARELVEPHGIEFRFCLITNGYFLTPDVVDELVAVGLKVAEVTIDGSAETHSITRVSKKGEDTFRRIFDNVINASRSIELLINGNYRPDTVHGFPPLIHQLAGAGLPAGTKFKFSPALKGLDAPSTMIGACTWSGSDMSHHVALQDEVLRAGFDRPEMHAVGPCMIHDRHGFAIDPDGTIYTCPGFMAHPEWASGHVRTGLTARHERMLAVDRESECGGCAHRPNCSGGCIAEEWLRRGVMSGVSCEGEYLDRVGPDSLKREYLLATSESRGDAIEAMPPQSPPLGEQSVSTRSGGRRSSSLRIVAA